MADSATNDLIAIGWVTSRVVLPPQQVKAGTLTLELQVGMIEAITLDGRQERGLSMLFPGAVGHVLNLRTIEQGLDQINRLPTQQVTINIQPGTRSGYSIVELTRVAKGAPLQLQLGIDNNGQRSQYAALGVSVPYGAWTVGASLNWNDSLESVSRNGASWPYRELNRQQQVYVHRLLYRDGNQKLSINGAL